MITAVANETSELKAEYGLRYVWLISIVAAMGGLLFGWDWVVIGGAKPFFQRYFELTSEAQIGFEPGETVRREARALFQEHAHLVVPVDIVERKCDQAEFLRPFGVNHRAALGFCRVP